MTDFIAVLSAALSRCTSGKRTLMDNVATPHRAIALVVSSDGLLHCRTPPATETFTNPHITRLGNQKVAWANPSIRLSRWLYTAVLQHWADGMATYCSQHRLFIAPMPPTLEVPSTLWHADIAHQKPACARKLQEGVTT